jgi:hypothetical protein
VKFYQCTMEKKKTNSKSVLTSWLPEKFAQKGHVIKLKNRKDGTWSDGWVIKNVGPFTRSQDEVVSRSQDYKRTRKVSDI